MFLLGPIMNNRVEQHRVRDTPTPMMSLSTLQPMFHWILNWRLLYLGDSPIQSVPNDTMFAFAFTFAFVVLALDGADVARTPVVVLCHDVGAVHEVANRLLNLSEGRCSRSVDDQMLMKWSMV